VVIRIYAPSARLVETVDLGRRSPGPYEYLWPGRTAAGSILPEGTYRVVQRLTDAKGNVLQKTHSLVLSTERLIWTTSTITRKGSRYFATADPGNGWIKPSRSAYDGGVRLASGTAGVAVSYRFRVREAERYGAVTFRVLGRSPNGRRVAEGLWESMVCGPMDVACYTTQTMGPGYAWWSIRGGPGNISEGVAYGAVIVPYDGLVRTFDVARVKLVYRWAVLGR
jgi:hypothetical protein